MGALLRIALAAVVMICGGCATSGPSMPAGAAATVTPPSRPMPVGPPPARTRDGEADAFGRAGSGDDPAEGHVWAPPVCPAGTRWEEQTHACVIQEVRCPRGSRKVGAACIGNVTCPDGATWDGASCVTVSARSPGSLCALQIDSVPQTEVLVDGRPVGPTPRQRVAVEPGTHTILFVGEDAKKVVTVTCKAGEVRSVAVQMRD